MLTGLIILFLWTCLSGLIYILIRNKKDSLSFPQILIFFGGKIIAGEIYGYIFKRVYHGDDTWALNNDSILQYKRLLQSPWQFIKDIFSDSPIPETGEYHFQFSSYLENLEYAIVTKTMALFNLISHGNYYINVVFFNFLGFFGVYFFYKLLADQFGKQNTRLAAIVLFLFPPALFWLSGIRTEGLLMLFTSILLYRFNRWLKEKNIVDVLVCVACFGMAIILRNGLALLLVPPLIAWWVVHSFKTGTKTTFAVTYIICVFVAIAGSFLLPANLNIFNIIADRQHKFFGLHGNTRFNLTQLTAHPLSFIKVLPESLLNTFVRPFMWEAKGVLQWFSSIENMVVLLLLIVFFVKMKRREKGFPGEPLVWVLLTAGLCNYIVIGYIVPFPGAIVRYKIIPELFLVGACLTPFLPGHYFRKNQSITASLQI